MSEIGIYFGSKLITIVETKGRRVTKQVQIPQSQIIGVGFEEEKVPEEIKLVSVLREALEKNGVNQKEAAICVSGKDLIIRTFDMPFLPANELNSAVNFEAKKYIPFKIEDLISDFQSQADKIGKRNFILFVGIKKETLDKYLSVFNELNIKISSLEYSAFSLLRLLQMAGIKEKGIISVLGVDLKEDDEANFLVLRNGFPLFSRDIIFSEDSPLTSFEGIQIDPALKLEKLKAELRISLDFYNRKFPSQKIESIFFISSNEFKAELESYVKERGLVSKFIDSAKFLGKASVYSLSLLKSYSSSLSPAARPRTRIDLLQAKSKVQVAQVAAVRPGFAFSLSALKINPKAVFLALAIWALPNVYGYYKKIPLNNELRAITGQRIQIPGVGATLNYEALKQITSKYNAKATVINQLLNNQVYLTEILDALARNIPKGLWLSSLEFKNDKAEKDRHELVLSGFAYLEQRDKELESINDFASAIKAEPAFSKYFKYVVIQSIDKTSDRDKNKELSAFSIYCRTY
ncbi:MAG: pilus assembly protein PilM [Candidatus Omnitrophica bacterium]|nr:pilus assembly protein PilM [Candidatus Omnitrophota bacterium]